MKVAAVVVLGVLAASCQRASTSSPAPAPAPTTSTAPAAPPAAAPTNAPAPGRGGGPGRGNALTPDSAQKLRQPYVDALMKEIAGRENEPATAVFKNVQVLTNLTAGQLVTTMNAYGRALTRNCTGCHVANDWAKDSLGGKRSARVMAQMVAAINTEHLPKLRAGRGGPPAGGAPPAGAAGAAGAPPAGAAGAAPGGRQGGGGGVTCMTCHHGLGRPNQSFDATLTPPTAPAGTGRGG